MYLSNDRDISIDMTKYYKKENGGDRKVGKIAEMILETISGFSEMIPYMIAPNARKDFKIFWEDNKKFSSPSYVNRTIERFTRLGFIKYKIIGQKHYLSLTDKGRQKLLRYKLSGLSLGVPKYWDHKWRVIIFDICEEKRGLRDMLRNQLVYIGFERLQNSVWIYPYECEEFVHLLKTDFGLEEDVIYMTVDDLENEDKFKKIFDL